MATDSELAYIAGILDGEGYIGIKKSPPPKDGVSPRYSARIQVRMVDEDAVAFIAHTLGGNYYRENPHADRGRPLFCFQASDRKAENILRAVLPWLRVKRHNALVVLEFRDLKANGHKHRTKPVGQKTMPHWTGKLLTVTVHAYSDEFLAMCETLYLRCKALNRTGV